MLIVNRRSKKGKGIVNYLIDHIPFEAHIPGGYQFCGPFTKLQERLARGDPGINKLDQFCKLHDLAYYNNPKDLSKRHEADRRLQEQAWTRVSAKDSTFGEKAAAWAVTNAMKLKLATGAGCKASKKRRSKKVKRGSGHKRKLVGPRVIPLPKTGGFLQYLMPILTGITAAGTAASSANEIMKTLQKLKSGSGIKGKVRLAPFRRGFGLYVKPWSPGNC